MSELKKTYVESPGTLRPNQMITTFGPGSIVQLEHDSVIIMGLDFWNPSEENYKKIFHPHLQRVCKKDYFLMPISKEEETKMIPCRSFPTWGYCSKKSCRRLQKHKSSPLAKFSKFVCEECRNDLLPARIILMCKYGHLDDFPWIEWTHSSKKDKEKASSCNQKTCVLEWNSLDKSTEFGDYYVKCRNCGSSRSMGPSTSRRGISENIAVCNGYSPWLDKTEKCVTKIKDKDGGETEVSTKVKGVLTRATSVYFSSVISGLLIPKWRHKVQIRYEDNEEKIRTLREHDLSLKQIAEGKIFNDLRSEYTVDEIVGQLEKRINFIESPENDESLNEMEIKQEEYENLIETDFEGDDEIKIKTVTLTPELQSLHIDVLKKIDRLTLIKVLRYFTRGDAPNPHSTENDEDDVTKCFISRKKSKWYPCVRNRGEGILFSINEEKLQAWEKIPEVRKRCDAILEGYKDWIYSRKWKTHGTISHRYILLHSISHALIRELSFSAGYSEASIAERIYYGNDYNAILLYTSSPSSDGSLGGLVRQGDDENFVDLIRNSMERSKHCSRDPLCIEEKPEQKKKDGYPPHTRLNGSACYVCQLLPETSCEESNRLLDRRLLFDEQMGFFNDI